MSFKVRCPRCNHLAWIKECSYGHHEVGCDFCGTRIMGEGAIRAMIKTQQAAYDVKLKAAKVAEKDKRISAKVAEKKRIAKRKVFSTPTPISAPAVKFIPEQKIAEKPYGMRQPTKAQKHRGATTRVHCSVCGTDLFRRKKEIEEQSNFFCNRDHQKQWVQAEKIRPLA